MERIEIEECVKSIKCAINSALTQNDYEEALRLIAICAQLLYESNIHFVDYELEDYLKKISIGLGLHDELGDLHDEILIFYDGFGLDIRGLALIYLKALCQLKRVIYVTKEQNTDNIPTLLKILNNNGAEIQYIKHGNILEKISQLTQIIEEYSPQHFFFYGCPDDVVATTVMYSYEKLKRYQINLTDHAFWLGCGCIDICIEFRNWGASISNEYRRIPSDKLRVLPFYPFASDISFEGYPFPFDENVERLIFSGGSLYKTFSKCDSYYKLVEYILENYTNVKFWYAGDGDSRRFEKLINKYQGRIVVTSERKDFFEIIKRCYFYLSTYPLIGGLMFQYAALAGKIPVTLKCDDGFEDGFLLNQDALGFECSGIEELKKKIDFLMDSPQYVKEQEHTMKLSVISEVQFQKNIERILKGNQTEYNLKLTHIDTRKFQEGYLYRMKTERLEGIYERLKRVK